MAGLRPPSALRGASQVPDAEAERAVANAAAARAAGAEVVVSFTTEGVFARWIDAVERG